MLHASFRKRVLELISCSLGEDGGPRKSHCPVQAPNQAPTAKALVSLKNPAKLERLHGLRRRRHWGRIGVGVQRGISPLLSRSQQREEGCSRPSKIERNGQAARCLLWKSNRARTWALGLIAHRPPVELEGKVDANYAHTHTVIGSRNDLVLSYGAQLSAMENQNGNLDLVKDGAAPESTDYANYFCTYAFLYHQKDMLEDHKRTGSYYNAVMQNRHLFEDRVVLDVGAGSGILAIFAAKAGARKVYGVEATSMAVHARQLVKANKLEDRIQIIQGVMESVEIPEKVDIIISEWMGYFLLRESMLDSVLYARDKYLAPGGALYPSHGRMYLAAIRSRHRGQRVGELEMSMEGWNGFIEDMRNLYGVDMDCLTEDFNKEQKEYYLNTAQWTEVHPSQLLGPAACFKEYDLLNVTVEELQKPVKSDFVMPIYVSGPVEAFAGFFDVSFMGSPDNPAKRIDLSTAPDQTGCTHWGQLSFYLHPPIECNKGDQLVCSITITRKKENHRLMNIELTCKLQPMMPNGHAPQERKLHFHVE